MISVVVESYTHIYMSSTFALAFCLSLKVSCSVTLMADPLLLVIFSIISWTDVYVRECCPVSLLTLAAIFAWGREELELNRSFIAFHYSIS